MTHPALLEGMGHNDINDYLGEIMENSRQSFKGWLEEREQGWSYRNFKQTMDAM